MTETERELMQAFATQSVEAERNRARATIADREGRAQEARLFRALAEAQQIHANKALVLLRGNLPLTDESLELAGETVEAMAGLFSDMIMTAATERVPMAETTAIQFFKASKSHMVLAGRVGEADSPYAVCQVCGYTVEGDAPDRCPVCRAAHKQFSVIE